MKLFIYLLLILSVACIGGRNANTTQAKILTPPSAVRCYSYIVRNLYPHSTSSYTQGLQYIDSQMWESTGLEGQSRLMTIDIDNGEQKLLAKIPDSEFGEGLTVWGDSIYMLTWQSNKAYIFNRLNGKIIDTKKYDGEGWGLTSDGEKLYMSNGTSKIKVRNPSTFKRESEIDVTLNGQPVEYLNELEWIEGKIWANVYTLNQIVIINPTNGVVEGVVDLTGILPASEITEQTDVLNGIAYDPQEKRIFVTGKNWSKLFEIDIIE